MIKFERYIELWEKLRNTNYNPSDDELDKMLDEIRDLWDGYTEDEQMELDRILGVTYTETGEDEELVPFEGDKK